MKEQLRKEIGMRLRKLRKTLGYTQEQMVSYFDIGRANYSRIEKGEIFPGAAILNRLKIEFDVSLDWLIANEGQMFHHLREGIREREEQVDFGTYSGEVRELLVYMDKVPMVKHAVLGFFLEYKMKNQDYIEGILHREKNENHMSP
ncbi:MAG: helix-turn-helix domain-containing protein [Candidatus Aminicenantes bacterium]|nr:helix-turn-helix domain-containing protein [Candidatus Aminicenantes bacterium]NIM84609.1 helix-turn-helix domain-containing protein [Candidatus Aminicenantes bacterium]NIN24131.1 helix-turn-helix domain-containing protein [Candidatus Aminicenantes bacterium]NIN47837.1 helix-turn-helix domain-containing protein [Candidatus Aminicenantes bacterium]NIN90775.1 helix-turn-helix domain-containing protein [Candidatus Aminicenantes bacterium]